MNPIVTSRSAYVSYLSCPRKRYWQYEAPNDGSTGANGWERVKFAIAPTTGIYIHKGLEARLGGKSPSEASQIARQGYLEEVGKRGLDVEVGADEQVALGEQAALVDAMVLAWCRVREPIWMEQFETVALEQEQPIALADDVILQTRADWIVRRKSDKRLFVVNFKSVNTADNRWVTSWETDMQLMTELLAAEQRFGEQFGGVIIEGLVKGRRQKEEDHDGNVTGYRETSKLIYGYKCDADPPLVPLQYEWSYTRKKGWYRFPVWQEQFGHGLTPIEYWIAWLPEEALEQSFCVVPPIMRNQQNIDSMVKQLVATERRIVRAKQMLGKPVQYRLDDGQYHDYVADLDSEFIQNTHACIYPSRCNCYNLCWEPGVSDDPKGSGLFTNRVPHHVGEESGE